MIKNLLTTGLAIMFATLADAGVVLPPSVLSTRKPVPAKMMFSGPSISYNTPKTYTVGTAIAPLTPTSNGVYAFGYNSNPQEIFAGSSDNNQYYFGTDAAGNFYVANRSKSTVLKVPPAGGDGVQIGSGFSAPFAVAVDPSGNVFVADTAAKKVFKIAVGTNTTTVVGSFDNPYNVITDASGNAYVADYQSGKVFKISATNNVITTLASGLSTPTGLAVDATGNIYVSERNAGKITKIPAGGGSVITVADGLFIPEGVALDNAGDIYVSLTGNDRVIKIPAGGGQPVTLKPDFLNPEGLTIDAQGNLIVMHSLDGFGGNISKVQPTGGYFINKPLPAGLNFDSNTGIVSGTATVATPATDYIITAYNPDGGTSAKINFKTVNSSSAPILSYVSPKTYIDGTAIAALKPTGSGVGAAGYNSTKALVGSGFGAPVQVSTNGSGTVYIADSKDHSIKKLILGNTTPSNIITGLNNPYGVTADAAGNIYFTDTNNSQVKEISTDGTYTTIGTGFTSPVGLAVDAAGNVYVADSQNAAVKEILASNGTTVTLGSGFTNAIAIALDGANNIYVSDLTAGTISKIPAGGGNPVVIASGLSQPAGLTVDNANNLYFCETGTSSIKKITTGGGTPLLVNSTFSSPVGISIDPSGVLYVGDATNNIYSLTPTGGYFISKPLPKGLTFNNATGVITGTPIGPSPSTDYRVAAYNASGGSSTLLNIQVRETAPATLSYPTPNTFKPGVAISALTPTSSGVGSAVYQASSGTVISGFSDPFGIAVDAAGNTFVTNRGTGVLTEIPAGGSATFTVASGFSNPYGVAVDGKGFLYVTNFISNVVNKISPDGMSTTSIGSGWGEPAGIAVDKKGTVFVADYGNNLVKKLLAGSNTPVTIGTTWDHPVGIAVDTAGNVYVAEFGTSLVKKIPAGSNTPVVIGTGFSTPSAVAVDASGNVFVSDYGNDQVKMISANGNTTTYNFNITKPGSLAIGPKGSIYIADSQNNQVDIHNPLGGYYLNLPLPTGLSLNNTTGVISGTPTTGHVTTNYVVTAWNSGGPTSATVSILVTPSNNATLSKLLNSTNIATTTVSGPDYRDYTLSVPANISSMTVTPTTQDVNATVKVNGTAVVSGKPSQNISLAVGTTVITTVVTAQDGTTTNTYKITVTRATPPLSSNALLAKLTNSTGLTTTVVRGPDYRDYKLAVPNSTSKITVTPTTQDSAATVKVNGITVKSGISSQSIVLAVGTTDINTIVTAQDGVTTNTYKITVTRAPSSNAFLAKLANNTGIATVTVRGADYRDYTLSVPNSTASIKVTPTTQDATATVTVNGSAVQSGTASQSIALAVGNTDVTTIVTAQDGTTTNTYKITVTRAAAAMSMSQNMAQTTEIADFDGLVIHKGVTPNNDGINDVFLIDGLSAFPDNKVTIINRGGTVVYEEKGYDNQTRVFDGYSNKNGVKQLPGTYFYILQYTANGKSKNATGYIVLKY